MAAFTAWCASVGRRPLPATPETVTEYVAHLTVTPSPPDGGNGQGGVLLAGHDLGLYADAEATTTGSLERSGLSHRSATASQALSWSCCLSSRLVEVR